MTRTAKNVFLLSKTLLILFETITIQNMPSSYSENFAHSKLPYSDMPVPKLSLNILEAFFHQSSHTAAAAAGISPS